MKSRGVKHNAEMFMSGRQYIHDRQINLDGKIILQKYAKCADCNGQINLSNFHISDAGEGKWLLLCKTHICLASRDGRYVGADKFKKKAGVEVVAASAVSAAKDEKATPERPSSRLFGAQLDHHRVMMPLMS